MVGVLFWPAPYRLHPRSLHNIPTLPLTDLPVGRILNIPAISNYEDFSITGDCRYLAGSVSAVGGARILCWCWSPVPVPCTWGCVVIRVRPRWPVRILCGCTKVSDDVQPIVYRVVHEARPGDHVLVLSNGRFGGIHAKLIVGLQENFAP